MSDQTTPFKDDAATNAAPAAAPAASSVADPATAQPTPAFTLPDSVVDMVGDGKKYADVNAALNALAPSQEHITRIEAENALLRDQAEQARNTEEVLADIKAAAQPQENAAVAVAPQLSTDDVASMVDQRLQVKAAKELAQLNTSTVVDKMTAHFGDAAKADEAYNNKAKELGMTIGAMNQLISTSPKAALKMFDLTPEVSAPQKIHSSVNTEALNINRQPEPVGSVMSGSTSKQQAAAWSAAAPKE